jgi:hypothetical protein
MKKYLILLIITMLVLSACKPDMSPERITKDINGAMNDCAKSPEKEQAGCYATIAEVFRTTDPDKGFQTCSLIKDDDTKRGCYDDLLKAQNDPKIKLNICLKVNMPDLKQACLDDASQALMEVDSESAFQACSAMPEPKNSERTPKQDCIDKLIQVQNSIDAKLAICKKVDNIDWKKTCIEQIANEEANATKAIAICDEIKNDDNFKQHCYGGQESKSANLDTDAKLTICDIRPKTEKDNCYRSIAEQLLDADPVKSVEICNKITDTNSKSNCLNNFMSSPEIVKANPTLAITLCDSQPISTKSRCYNDLARTFSGVNPKQAVEICKKLSDDVQISDCYSNVWFSFSQIVAENYDYTISLCKVLSLKKDDCLQRTVGVFMDLDRARAEATCKLMSAAGSSSCLQQVQRK